MDKIFFTSLLLCIAHASAVLADGIDPTTIDNVVFLANDESNVGETTPLSIQMNNTAPIRGFQFKLILPEGVTLEKNTKGKIKTTLNQERLDEDDDHLLSVSEQEDGSYLFLCGSQYDESFIGNEGEIVTIYILVDRNVKEGDYPIIIKDIKLTETDISKYYEVDELSSTLKIEIPTTISDINHETPKNKHYYDISGRQSDLSKKGVYIVNGKKVLKSVQ